MVVVQVVLAEVGHRHQVVLVLQERYSYMLLKERAI
jgi:hypothetical protein